MSSKGSGQRPRSAGRPPSPTATGDPRRTPTGRPRPGGRSGFLLRPSGWLAVAVAAAGVILVAAFGAGLIGGTGAPTQRASSAEGVTIQANGGHWTNITPGRLATMLTHKDFTLLNVKTPYVGEIAGTDLYVPYDQITARAAELPTDKQAKIVVYCRTGHESAIASQTLIDLGYTNIDNLDGGMTAWTASGRQLVTVNRTGG